jgi:hypothetical protein
MEGERGNEVLEKVNCMLQSFHLMSNLNNQADYILFGTFYMNT